MSRIPSAVVPYRPARQSRPPSPLPAVVEMAFAPLTITLSVIEALAIFMTRPAAATIGEPESPPIVPPLPG